MRIGIHSVGSIIVVPYIQLNVPTFLIPMLDSSIEYTYLNIIHNLATRFHADWRAHRSELIPTLGSYPSVNEIGFEYRLPVRVFLLHSCRP